ncbi:non-ribosomal peptide synthetase [Streptosporangium sp. CA-135522]|uniref:non-ribosomal peptide synthetase n=1 Tax=Streptosporangium sp. CA-135522 TaxID=3240072 RepID=UPI003D904EFB
MTERKLMTNLPELLAAQAALTPDAVAVVVGEQEIGFRELDERADRLARRLTRRGAGPDVLVGLYVGRSLDMIVALLAVLKSGAAYLPLETAWPTERLAQILGDARPPLVLTQEALAAEIPECGAVTVCVDTPEEPGDETPREADAENLAYVIYTSGSTGRPKGVMIDHRALSERVVAKADLYGLAPGDRVLQFTGLGFDAAADEIYPTLISGAALVVHSNPSWTSPLELLDECERRGVTGVMLPPVYFRLLVETLALTGRSMSWMRLFITGGESIPVDRLVEWARLAGSEHRFFYAYGPTETTIAATMYEAPMDPARLAKLERVPIGRALPRTGTHVLDAELEPVQAGTVGELWVTGAGLARGYVGDAALTAERFVPSPYGRGERMYRTGDLARVTPGGDLEFAGRVDDQVKIRGYRVDLGEVETVLATHPDLAQVVVTATDGRLAAYCVPRLDGEQRHAPPDPRELRRFAGGKLPDYMVPSAFVWLEALPLTSGGKVDRAALPEPREDATLTGSAPGTPIEQFLSEIWCDLLERDSIGTSEDFFEAGGNSLLANQVVARVRDRLGIELPLSSLFRVPTIAALAAVITPLALDDELLDLLDELEAMPEDAALAEAEGQQ